MEGEEQKSNKRMLGIIVFIVIVFILFTANIKSIVNSSNFQKNVSYIEQKSEEIWNKCILKSVDYVWNNIIFGDLLKVKPETQNRSKIKLKGKGFPVYRKEGLFGDLYITYVLKIPTNLTDRQKALFVELSKS